MYGGDVSIEEKWIQPSIFTNCTEEDSIMKEEVRFAEANKIQFDFLIFFISKFKTAVRSIDSDHGG